MTREEVIAAVRSIVAQVLEVDEDSLVDSKNFSDGPGQFDSLAAIEIADSIEDEFDGKVKFEDDDLQVIDSLNDLYAFVFKQLGLLGD